LGAQTLKEKEHGTEQNGELNVFNPHNQLSRNETKEKSPLACCLLALILLLPERNRKAPPETPENPTRPEKRRKTPKKEEPTEPRKSAPAGGRPISAFAHAEAKHPDKRQLAKHLRFTWGGLGHA